MRDESGWRDDEAERIYRIRQGHPYALRLASFEIKRFMKPGIPFDVAFEAVEPEIIDLTYRHLFDSFSAEERIVVEILSLDFRGFDFGAIEYIGRRSGLKRNSASILAQLHERAAIANTGESQFRLLPQDQVYVYGQISAPDSLHEYAVAYFRERLGGHESRPYHAVEDIATRIFFHATRSGNIKAAFEVFTILREKPDMYDFSAALTSMCNQLREHHKFGALPTTDQGLVSQYAGRLYRHMGEIGPAETALTEALEKFQEAGEPVLYAATLSDIALTIRKQGEYSRELKLYDQALDVLGSSTDQDAVRTRSYVLGRKAQALQMKGTDPQVTFECFKEAVALARQTDDKELLVTRLGMIGNAYRELSRDFPAALQCYLEAVQISEQTEGNPDLEAALSGLAKTYEKSRDFKGALKLYLKALAHTEDNDLYGLLDRLGSLAHVYKSLSRLEESIAHYERAISIAAKVSNRKAEAENLAGLGSAYRIQADRARESTRKSELLDNALRCHKKAVEIQDSMEGDPSGVTNRYQELGRTLLAMNKPVEARPLFVIAGRSAHEARKPYVESWQFRRLGETLDALNRHEDAVLCYAQAFRLNPDEIDNMKAIAEEAFRELPPESKPRVMMRMKEMDREIQAILERES
jgi:tetratricopeptide (TPR) repeat protein